MIDDTVIGQREELLYPVAAEMAAHGATRGMIVRELRDEKLDEFTAASVADRALRAVARRKRIAGLGVMAVGLLILVMAWCSTALFRAKIPIALAMLGLIVLGLGISQVTHRTSLAKDSFDSKPRIR